MCGCCKVQCLPQVAVCVSSLCRWPEPASQQEHQQPSRPQPFSSQQPSGQPANSQHIQAAAVQQAPANSQPWNKYLATTAIRTKFLGSLILDVAELNLNTIEKEVSTTYIIARVPIRIYNDRASDIMDLQRQQQQLKGRHSNSSTLH